MSNYIKTEKGIEKVPQWIGKHLFNSNALYNLEKHIHDKIAPVKQKKAQEQADYFYTQFYKLNA